MATSADVEVQAWTPNDSTFGARLALVRQRMGWGNVKLAAFRCGIPAQSWRTWERDGVNPRSDVYFRACERIAAASGCDYGWLVDRRPTGASEVTRRRIQAKLAASTDSPVQTPPRRGHLTLIRNSAE